MAFPFFIILFSSCFEAREFEDRHKMLRESACAAEAGLGEMERALQEGGGFFPSLFERYVEELPEEKKRLCFTLSNGFCREE